MKANFKSLDGPLDVSPLYSMFKTFLKYAWNVFGIIKRFLFEYVLSTKRKWFFLVVLVDILNSTLFFRLEEQN